MKATLSVKIIGLVFFFTLVLFSLQMYLTIEADRNFLFDAYMQKSKYIASSVNAGVRNSEDLANRDLMLNSIYRVMWLEPDVVEMSIDLPEKDGLRRFVSSDNARTGMPSEDLAVRSYAEGAVFHEILSSDEGKVLRMVSPIQVSGKTVGAVLLDFSTDNVEKVIAGRTAVLIGESCLVMSVFVFVVYYLLMNVVIGPIREINSGLEAVTRNDYDYEVKPRSTDEIGQLAESFNQMAREVKRSREDLKKSEDQKREELEVLVRARTADIEDKSRDLEKARAATLNILEDMEGAKEALEKSYEELKGLDDMKDDFVGATSHALKTPLTSINSFIELLRKGKLGTVNEDQKDGLDVIAAESQRLHVLINNILDASKLDSGRMVLEKRRTDLKELVEKSIRSVSSTAASKGDRILLNAPEEVYVNLDPAWIEKTLDNLVSNAVKYTDNGNINIKLEKDARGAKFTMTDTGRGIAPENIAHLFKKFYQGEKQTTTGTGLGLYICKNVIEAHGGKIGCESAGPDKGATFWFTLPA